MDFATYFTPDDTPSDLLGTELDDEGLRRAYAYPTALTRPWVRVNFVSSIDGAVTADGVSAGLGTPSDTRVFGVLRALADVVVVGAGTVRSEDYGGVRLSADDQARRSAAGQPPVPRIVVVTASASLDPTSRLFTDTAVPPTVVTSASAPLDARRRLETAGAHVVAVDGDVSTAAVVAELHRAGEHRVLLEGGPGLFGTFLGDDAVDEICLTVSPVAVAGSAGRISHSPAASIRAMSRAHVLAEDDGTLLTRWVRTPEKHTGQNEMS
nr:pyrimidine reductase family protein [Rhodococcus kyotonensis]